MISLLLAMDRNNLIGENNDLPWHLPKDLRFFKEKTLGNTIIMGRKTFESIGSPLPKRENIVITSGSELEKEVTCISSVDTIMEWNKKNPEKEYFVIGGGRLFEQVLPFADRMYITLIDEAFQGDTYFPEISYADWEETSKVKGEKDESNPYDYYFIQYDRVK
ncbi:Dihydrofolate reductase [Oceanobacillus picturae]|jgi:dihydrofolate reductase|uniref:Dihydrofolate reductase n=1 Tax=Oceanobacillus picturae TaxID=171693 RepID=W9A9F2_9BACI|nr:dihydrofolate reductase [Oceanobacillus picturae]RIU96225.1 dihydrofolate reductase [Oceanobacillus picturae]CDO02088.1 Dihydrofolate reductase [Oceanobacillus picturae]